MVIIFLSSLVLNFFLVKLKTFAGFLNVMAQFLLKQRLKMAESICLLQQTKHKMFKITPRRREEYWRIIANLLWLWQSM